jgi:hypothetical protein
VTVPGRTNAQSAVKDELWVPVGKRSFVICFEPAGVPDAKAKMTSPAKQAMTQR